MSFFSSFIPVIGSWTPVITGSGGSSGQVYTTQLGSYIKIGKLIRANFRIKLSTLGTITGSVQVANFPFPARTGNDLSIGTFLSFDLLTTNWIWIGTAMLSNTSIAQLFGIQAAGTTTPALVQADLSNTTEFIGSITYLTPN